MITPEKIQQNWTDLENVIKTHIAEPRRQQLLDLYNKYQDRIILMPASSKKEYHNSFPGGYVDHVIRVIHSALALSNVWEAMGADMSTFTKEELVFSALNHDLGKIGDEDNEAYVPQTDQWRRDKLGEEYTHNTKLEYMTVPERSLYLLTANGIKYSKNELLAIRLHDGLYEEANKSYIMGGWAPETKPRTDLIFIIHQADLMASRIEFENEWNPKFNIASSLYTGKTITKTNHSNTKIPIKAKALSTVKVKSSFQNMLNEL